MFAGVRPGAGQEWHFLLLFLAQAVLRRLHARASLTASDFEEPSDRACVHGREEAGGKAMPQKELFNMVMTGLRIKFDEA